MPAKYPSPEIELDDLDDKLVNAYAAVGPGIKVNLYRQNTNTHSSGWRTVFDGFEQRLASARKDRSGIDEGLAHFIANQVELTRHVQLEFKHKSNISVPGKIRYQLLGIGCRVTKTQEALATAYGCSRQHVNEQIKKLKKALVIVRWGRGWFEFDANIVWRGKASFQRAYSAIQKSMWPDELDELGLAPEEDELIRIALGSPR
jgi:hypothetical protein